MLLEADEPASLEPQGPEVGDEVARIPLHRRADGGDSSSFEVPHQRLPESLAHAMPLVRGINPDDPDPSNLLILAEVPRPDVPDKEPDDLALRLRDEARVPFPLREIRGEAPPEGRGLPRAHDRAFDLHGAR